VTNPDRPTDPRDFSLPSRFVTSRVITSARILYHPSHPASATVERSCISIEDDHVFIYWIHVALHLGRADAECDTEDYQNPPMNFPQSMARTQTSTQTFDQRVRYSRCHVCQALEIGRTRRLHACSVFLSLPLPCLCIFASSFLSLPPRLLIVT